MANQRDSLSSAKWLRAATFGAMDGLVSNMSLIAGVAGGGIEPSHVFLAGVAGLLAGALSMGLGEYVSVQAFVEAHGNARFNDPKVAAISSFISFAVGAFIPVLPYALGATVLWPALVAGGLGLFIVGAVICRFTGRSWWSSGLRQLLFGALATAATYFIGVLIGVSVAG